MVNAVSIYPASQPRFTFERDIGLCAGMLDAIDVLGAVGLCDIGCLLVDEGLTIFFHRHQRWQLPN